MKHLIQILPVAGLLGAPVVIAAQRLAPVPSYAVATMPPLSPDPHFAADSVMRKLPRTYWLEGGVVAGLAVGTLSALWFRGMSDSRDNLTAGTIAGFVLGAAVGFPAGSLIGGQFRKPGQGTP